MSDDLHWGMVEDLLEQMMREDGSYDGRTVLLSNPAPALKSSNNMMLVRLDTSFEPSPESEDKGDMLIRMSAFGDHPLHGMVMLPIEAKRSGTFEDCVKGIVEEAFDLHYKVMTAALTGNRETVLFRFMRDAGQGAQDWALHASEIMVEGPKKDSLLTTVEDAGLVQEMVPAIARGMNRDGCQPGYISASLSGAGKLEARMEMNGKEMPKGTERLMELVGPILEEHGPGSAFKRFLLVEKKRK